MKRKQIWYIWAFALPVILWGIIYALWSQYPFGENTLLIWDMKFQYVSFFCHLRDILHGQASGIYSFSRAVGGEMSGVLSYYLLSPFHLIIYFFDRENIYIGIMLIALCKVGAGGLTMYLFLAERKAGYGALLFSCAYAVNAYVVGYQFNIFWMDALVILPLMVLGIEKLIDEGKQYLYVGMIALAVITNFYTGYMLCIFSVLYFWCYLLLISEKRDLLRRILQYHAASLLGGMLAACVAVPTFFALNGGKANRDLSILLRDQTSLTGWHDMLRAAFCGEISTGQMTAGRPLLYGSILAVVFAGYDILFSKECKKRKIAYILLFSVLAVSFRYKNLNCIWHGMQYPMGSPHRFSFLFVFLLIELAYRGFLVWEMDTERTKKNVIYKLLYLLLLWLAIYMGYRTLAKAGIWINFLLAGSYIFLMIAGYKKSKMICLFVLAAELILNAELLYLNSAGYQSVTKSEWENYIERMTPLMEQVGEDQDFARTAWTGDVKFTNNDGFLWNVYGLESYTSLEKWTVQEIAENMGYAHSINFGMSYGTGAASTSDALLGVRYLISSEPYGAPYEALCKENGLTLYRNRAAFPLAYLADASVLDIEPEKLSVFAYENELLHSVDTSCEKDVFLQGTLGIENMQNVMPDEDGRYVRKNKKKEAYITYRASVLEQGTAYLQDDSSGASKVELFLNGEKQDLSEQTGAFKKLGELSPEDQVYVRFYIGREETFCGDALVLAVEQTDVLETYAKLVQAQNMDITMKKEQDIAVQCTNDAKEERYLMFSIPYDEAWHAYVDGKQAEIIENDHQMLILPLKPGEHLVELRYIPKGSHAGLVISIIAVCLIVGERYCKRRYRGKIVRENTL